MTEVKHYPGLEEIECYQVTLDKICNTFAFKAFIASKCSLCPADLTIECCKAKEGLPGNPKYIFAIVITKLDYGDCTIHVSVEENIKEAVKEYFKTFEPVLYKEMESYMY